MIYRRNLSVLLMCMVLLTACGGFHEKMKEPTMLTKTQPVLALDTALEESQGPAYNRSEVLMILDQMGSYADPVIDVTLVYDPFETSEEEAQCWIEKAQKRLGNNDVQTTTASLLPLIGEKPRLMTRVSGYKPEASPECKNHVIPGLKAERTGHEARDYKLGCSVQAAFAAQIADPQDALGRSGVGANQLNGEKAYRILETLRSTGESQGFVESFIVSDSVQASE